VFAVGELGKLALQHKIGLHVDLCLGGFLLPFLEKSGHLRKGAVFDFRVAGVSSLSAGCVSFLVVVVSFFFF
jgi:sphinganine-1-phosphate aldolase